MARYYRLSTCDERDNNFITLWDNLEGGPLIYCAYLDIICHTCHSIDKDALFARKQGLEGGPKIRVSRRREFAEARDGFLCVKDRVVKLLKQHRVAGYQTRRIPYTDWHVLRVTTKVPFKDFKPEREKPPCKECGRGAYYGIAETSDQIAVPEHENSLFTPEIERGQGFDVYMTERVAHLLKEKGVRGGSLIRLMNEEEHRLMRKGTPAARRKVKDLQIWLT